MSIFGDICKAILDSTHATDVVKAVAEKVEIAATGTTPSSQTTLTHADIEKILQKMDDAQDEDLDWRHSLVDLMKLLDLDSSIHAREKLAHELGYPGVSGGSAGMNQWLHAQVMKRLAESGGKVPDSLRGG